MGTTALGVPFPEPTDDVRDAPQQIEDLAEAIDALLPRHGSSSGTTDATGWAVITHGLGFTPSAVFVQGNLTSPIGSALLPIGVDSIGATTFRVRLAPFVLSSGSNYFVKLATVSASYDFNWVAFK